MNLTTSTIQTNLIILDNYIENNGNNITKFNGHMKLLVDALRARGELANDLFINLFKVYLTCSDNEFVNYIKHKKESYEEGG